MKKKILLGLALLIATIILTSVFTAVSFSKAPDTGTCCYQYRGTCVIGTYVEQNAYYLPEGPCQ